MKIRNDKREELKATRSLRDLRSSLDPAERRNKSAGNDSPKQNTSKEGAVSPASTPNTSKSNGAGRDI